jgi:hypothetical protein
MVKANISVGVNQGVKLGEDDVGSTGGKPEEGIQHPG